MASWALNSNQAESLSPSMKKESELSINKSPTKTPPTFESLKALFIFEKIYPKIAR